MGVKKHTFKVKYLMYGCTIWYEMIISFVIISSRSSCSCTFLRKLFESGVNRILERISASMLEDHKQHKNISETYTVQRLIATHIYMRIYIATDICTRRSIFQFLNILESQSPNLSVLQLLQPMYVLVGQSSYLSALQLLHSLFGTHDLAIPSRTKITSILLNKFLQLFHRYPTYDVRHVSAVMSPAVKQYDKKNMRMASLTVIFTRSGGTLQPARPLGRVVSRVNWPSKDQCQRSHSK